MVSSLITRIILLAITFQVSAFSSFAQTSSYVRISVVREAESVNIKVRGPYTLIDSTDNKTLDKGKNLSTTVTAYKKGLLLSGKNFDSNKLLISVKNPALVAVNGRKFRDGIQILRNENGKLSVINRIGLEDYIKGILYNEVSHYWPMEALKAQAIVSRTYASYYMQENKTKDFDLTSDVYSQVYGGKSSERYRTSRAVEETKGKVLTFDNKLFPAYFHSACGGHTEDASKLWDINIAPLKGVICGYCNESPHFKWHSVIPANELMEKLAEAGLKVKDITDIKIEGTDDSGRITNLELIDSEGKISMVSSKDFRNSIGPNIIRSTNFKVDLIEDEAVLEGFGWGHGVGLCQWGAYFMSKQGLTAEQILKYYYPETNVETFEF